MITEIRKYLNGKFFRSFIVFLCIVMTGVFSIPFFLKQDSVPLALTVNGIKITQAQLDYETNQQQERLAQFRLQYGKIADYLLKSMNMSSNPKELAIQKLEQDALLEAFAQKIGAYPITALANEILHNQKYQFFVKMTLPEYVFNEDGTINEFGIRAYFQRAQITADGFYASLSRECVRALLNGLVEGTAYIPKNFLENMKLAYSGKKVFNYIEFSLVDYIQKAVNERPSDTTLKTFYEEERASYAVPEKRHITEWTFDSNHYDLVIHETALIDYYEKHKNSLFVEKQSLTTIQMITYKEDYALKPALTDLRDELRANPDLFEEKAKLFSDDKKTASNGGLVPPFSRGTLDPLIEKAAFGLEKVGEISDIIVLSDGFALIKLVQKTPRTFLPFEKVKNEVQARVKNTLFLDQFIKDTNDLSNITIDVAQKFSKLHHGLESNAIVRSSDNDDIRSKKVFSADIGHGGLYTSQDRGHIFVLNKIESAYIPSLDDIKEKVVRNWQEKQALNALNTDINDLKKMLQNEESLKDIAQKMHYSLKKTDLLGRADELELKKLEKEGLPVSRMIALEVPLTIAISFDGEKGFLVQLEKVVPDYTMKSIDSQAVEKAFNEQNRHHLVRGLIATLNKTANIEYNQQNQALFEDYGF